MFTIKICGVTRLADARAAVELGADAIGLNFYARSPRFVERDPAIAIARGVAGQAAVVGVFVNESPEGVVSLARACGLSHVQIHGDEPPEYLQHLCALAPGEYALTRAFRCGPEGLGPALSYLKQARALGARLAGVLVDGFHPQQYGGSGARADWNLIAPLEGFLEGAPLILAGGLNADNVGQAIATARPWGVDVASGVEASPGVKDARRMERFILAARAALSNAGLSSRRQVE